MPRARQAFAAWAVFCWSLSAVLGQTPQPGAEHQKLKELEGTWDSVMKLGGAESKGTMVWKMDLGGLWLTSDYQSDFAGQKFSGRGFDGYDPIKKKYVAMWVDSWSTSPVVSEGTYDPAGKVLTLLGEGPGQDGKPTKYRMTTEHQDKDTVLWTMYSPGSDGKEVAMLSITYKRRR